MYLALMLLLERAYWRQFVFLHVSQNDKILDFTVAFACLFAFLNVSYQREASWKKQFARIDVVGNLIFVGAIVACLTALT